MRKHTKIVLAMLLALVLCLSWAVTVSADEGTNQGSGTVTDGNGNTINWTIDTNSNTLSFTGEGAIPDYVAGTNSPWQEGFELGQDIYYYPLESVEKVVIGGGITRVGNCALKDFIKVKEVELPESLSEIGNDAFNRCIALTSIKIPGKVETIGDDAFSGCIALSEITLSENLTHIGKTALCKTALESVTLPSGLTSMGESVFSGCEKLEAVRFNGNIKLEELPASTFSRCTALSLVELPKKLKTIGECAFNECKALKGIDLPDTLEEIGERAFSTSGLVSIEIPSGVSSLENMLFSGCENLKRVAFGNNIKEKGSSVFEECSDKDKYILYSGTKEQFENYNGLETVNDHNAFKVIYNYKKGIVNASIEEAGSGIGKAIIKWDKYYDLDPAKDAAGYKIEMKNENGDWINLPDSQITNGKLDSEIKDLEPGKEYIFKVLAYYNYQESQEKIAESEDLSFTPSNVIKSGKIGENNNITWEISPAQEQGKFILTISGRGNMPDYSGNSEQPWYTWRYNGAICYSDSISRIIIKDGITGIGDYNFKNFYDSKKDSGLTEVTLPKSLKTIGSKAFGSCEKLSILTLKEGLESIDEFAFSETALTNVNIPKSVKSIGRYAFAFNEGLETVSLNEGLETIATSAFQQCPIKDITIPASVKEIGTAEGSPFGECPELVSISVAEGNNCVKVVDGVLFSKDGKRLIQYPAGKEESTYTVPSGTEKIEPYAFSACMKLQNIIISEGVKSIGDCAFAGSKMESVNIPDSVTELGLFLFAQGSAGKVILPINLDKDHLIPVLFMATEAKDVYFPGSKEEWQALEDSFRSISDEGKLEILKTMYSIMGEGWEDPETEEAKQDLIGMYDMQFGSFTLLDYNEEKGEMLSANLICNYREDLSDKGYEIDNIPEQTYQGSPVKPDITVRNKDGILYPGCYSVEYKNNTKAGTGTVTVTGTGRYKLTLSKNFNIIEKTPKVTAPVAKAGLKYNGKARVLVKAGSATGGTLYYALTKKGAAAPAFDGASASRNKKWSVNVPTAVNPGDYTVWYVAKGDRTHTDSKMGRINVSIAYNSKRFTVTLNKASFTYDGKVKTPTVTVKYNGKTAKKSTYTLKWSGKRIDVGTYRVNVMPKGKTYKGVTGSATFKITKGKNTLKVSTKTKPLKASALKKKAQPVAISKLITVKKAQGAVKYKLISKDKSLTYNPGKKTLTLMKGAGKGDYKAKFMVTAAGNKNYEKGETEVTVKIQVK